MQENQDVLNFYSQPGALTDLREYRDLLQALPGGLPALVKAVQGLTLHVFWAERYGVRLDEARRSEVQIRPAVEKLARLLALDSRPLNEPRSLEARLVGNCRDIAVLLAALLRAQGRPARARCGFGTYFNPGRYEDHWMVEVWDAARERWLQVDPQLDSLQREALKIDFDPLDMPRGRFVLAGDAWEMCREGKANPDYFGIFQWHGWDFIRGNVFRDLLALNKIEPLPWDFWGLLKTPYAECTPAQQALVDRAARITAAGNAQACWKFYQENEGFHAPEEWLS
jgi:hypothetical protein